MVQVYFIINMWLLGMGISILKYRYINIDASIESIEGVFYLPVILFI